MATINLYSKRQAKTLENQSNTFVYNDIPKRFRIQFIKMLEHVGYFPNTDREYKPIVEYLQIEYGMHRLSDKQRVLYSGDYSYRLELFDFFEDIATADQCLDIIELISKKICADRTHVAKEYLDELDCRFKENNLGYRFVNNKIIKIDNELLHSSVVKPALQFLTHSDYKITNTYFSDAFEDYKKGNLEDVNHKCRKTFESIMKVICNKRGYKYNEKKDDVKTLLNTLKSNNFFPTSTEDHLNHLVGLLQGIGTIANKNGSHGKGAVESIALSCLTSYILHITASMILFFADIEKQK